MNEKKKKEENEEKKENNLIGSLTHVPAWQGRVQVSCFVCRLVFTFEINRK